MATWEVDGGMEFEETDEDDDLGMEFEWEPLPQRLQDRKQPPFGK